MGEAKKVYEGIANTLQHLSVEKNGTLPSNMGGKPYITAHDIAAEVKRKFVENNLIFLPSETVVKHENILANNRLQVSIVVSGEYTIVSTEDGSSVTISGTGDGLATGTAVASNIASTNALKNALLRTFLITEQSVEEAAKNGVGNEAAPSAAQAKLNKAAGRTSAGGGKAPSTAGEFRTAILAAVKAGGDVADYSKIGERISGKPKSAWVNDEAVLSRILDALNKGEVE